MLGIRVGRDGFNYKNWKKIFYGITLPNATFTIEAYEKSILPAEMRNHINFIAPRPLPKFADDLQVSAALDLIRDQKKISEQTEHPFLKGSERDQWKSLPLQKKVILQILASIDFSKKVQFIFWERTHLNPQQGQQVYEFLKSLATNFSLSVVVWGDPNLIPNMHWVPLLQAPIDGLYDLGRHDRDDEDEDEEVA